MTAKTYVALIEKEVKTPIAKINKAIKKIKKKTRKDLKTLRELAEKNIFINYFVQLWDSGLLKSFLYWTVWMICGTSFYSLVNFDGNVSQSFYYSINVGYSIGWGVLHDHNSASKAFSMFYLLVGATFVSRWLAFIIENAIKIDENSVDDYIITKSLRDKSTIRNWILRECYIFMVIHHTRLFVIYIWIVYIFLGTLWSCLTIKWSLIDGLYFALSSLSTGGLQPIPVDSPNWMFVFVGVYAATGVPIMGMAVANLAAIILVGRHYEFKSKASILEIEEEEKQMISVISNDPMIRKIDQKEYLLLMLLRKNIISIEDIQYYFNEFDEKDILDIGFLTISENETNEIKNPLFKD